MDKLKKFLLSVIFILCISIVSLSAYALGGYDDYQAYDGDGWSMSDDGVMTIESNQGWANCIRDGYKPEVRELVIGKDVTYFRMYSLPEDLPSPDFFDSFEVAGYDKNGEPYYNYSMYIELSPLKITVEAGNRCFRVVDGLLINTVTSELVLSEMGVTDVVIPEGVKVITRDAFKKRDLTSVQFPSSLEVIGEDAFALCANLTEIELPDSIIELGGGAFIRCDQLSQVILPSKLQVLGAYAFSECPITYIEIPKMVEEIGAYAFSDCYSLKRAILPDSLVRIGDRVFSGCNLSILRIPANLTFIVYDRDKKECIVNPYTKKNKTFGLSSVDTVIFSGSEYDFGYPAITNAKNVYFLGKPPEDVGQMLDKDSVEKIYCSDEFEFEWTRSTVASWVRQKLTILPADQINSWAEATINTTPEPTNTPTPTPRPSPTPWPTPMPRPTASPAVTAEPEKQAADPMLFVFAGVLALVVAGIAVVAVKGKKTKKHLHKK